MWYKIRKGIFPTLIALSALSVSASAAFYSITGLSKLFAGAQTEVIIMASSLELAKLVIASLLYRYRSTVNKILKTYLSIACVILVLITSMGIYGFLSAAYQETYSELAINQNQKKFLNKKIEFYEEDVERYDKEIENIISNINNLSTTKSRSIQVRDTTTEKGYRNTISNSQLRLAQKRIKIEEQSKKQAVSLRKTAVDSLQKYKVRVLELENNLDQAGELGPLKYLAGVTNYPMGKIINVLLLVIIFVFDPLAISLVIAANFAFEKAFGDQTQGSNQKLTDNQQNIVDEEDDDDYDVPQPNQSLANDINNYDTTQSNDNNTSQQSTVDDWELVDEFSESNSLEINDDQEQEYSQSFLQEQDYPKQDDQDSKPNQSNDQAKKKHDSPSLANDNIQTLYPNKKNRSNSRGLYNNKIKYF